MSGFIVPATPPMVGERVLASDRAAAQFYRSAAKRVRAEAVTTANRKLLRTAQEYEWRAACMEGTGAGEVLRTVPHAAEASEN